MVSHPFIVRSNHRTLEKGDSDVVYVWDIDKTYLDTHFSSVRGLFAIPFEFAVDKRAVPGAVPLLRAIRRGPGDTPRVTPLYFVSGSPPQLRAVVERKMTLDGVHFDGITFKDQWGFVKAGRPKGVKEQVGYKLRALLLYRQEMPIPTQWYCFGDDAESDADVFPLFGEVCAGLRGAALEARLKKHHVHKDDIKNIHAICETTPVTGDPVTGVFIHLYNRTDPARLATDRVFPTRSFLQAALVLAQRGEIRPEAVGTVARRMRRDGLVPDHLLRRDVEDAVLRFGPLDDELLAYALDEGV